MGTSILGLMYYFNVVILSVSKLAGEFLFSPGKVETGFAALKAYPAPTIPRYATGTKYVVWGINHDNFVLIHIYFLKNKC